MWHVARWHATKPCQTMPNRATCSEASSGAGKKCEKQDKTGQNRTFVVKLRIQCPVLARIRVPRCPGRRDSLARPVSRSSSSRRLVHPRINPQRDHWRARIQSHRLVVNADLVQKDFESTQQYSIEHHQRYQLFFQLTRITRDKAFSPRTTAWTPWRWPWRIGRRR